jgi:hypothetical protein
VTQLVLPLHEASAKPLQFAVESVANSAAEPLHSTADPAAALIETSCLCV